MKDIRELMEVNIVIYTDGAGADEITTVKGIVKGWIHPTRITGILPGGIVLKNSAHGIMRTLDGSISRGQEFTLLRSSDGNILAVGTPDELHKKVADKLKEILKP